MITKFHSNPTREIIQTENIAIYDKDSNYDIIPVMVPELSCVISLVEEISRDYFYKVHTKRLLLMKQQEYWLPIDALLMFIASYFSWCSTKLLNPFTRG